MQNFNILAILYSRAGWFESYLVVNSEDRSSYMFSELHVKISWLLETFKGCPINEGVNSI